MHSNVDEHLTKKALRATKAVVSASNWTIGGTMDQSELEDFISSMNQYGCRISLEGGVLNVRLGRG